MPDYFLLMHRLPGDSEGQGTPAEWEGYLAGLRASGRFQGGSAIGDGICVQKASAAPGVTVTSHLSGFIRISADDLEDARSLLAGNPVFENGGTVEIRELLRRD